ncbi:unnamed protein product [Leuciscus chuanchicus]
MKILLIFFTFSLISGAVRCVSVTGYSGGSLLVDSGKLWYSYSSKYMAKLHEWGTIINDKKHDKWINEGRFTLFKNNEGKLMIYIRDLIQHDAGRYQIRVEGQWSIDMTLNVEEDLYCKESKRVMVNIGETANFSCEYSQNHINDSKIIFKEGKDYIEMIYSKWYRKERISVSDGKHKNLFNVRITAVTPDDGGVYLCGVWIYRHSYSYSIINTVHLHIMDKVSRATGHSGGRMMIKCEHPQHKTKPKYIRKISDGCSERKNPGVQDEWMENGDVSLYDDTSRSLDDAKYPKTKTESAHLGEEVNITCQITEEHKVHFCKEDDDHICQNISTSAVTEMSPSSERNEERVFTVSISNVSVRDAGVYWCGAETRDTHLTFISLTTKIQLNLFMAPVVRREGESAEIFCPYDSIYKSKSKSLCKGKCSTRDRNTLNETINSHDELPTIPSAGLLYASVSFQKHEESLSEASVTVSKNELYSDYVTINSHDELPTIPSDELLYASVSFQKHEESLSEASVTVSKNELYSDYATVSRRMRLN